MSIRRSALLLIAALSLPGCQSLTGPNNWFTGGPTHARENPVSDDPWVREAGDITRTEHPSERIEDPLGLRNIFTSEKAREIERNVGVGD